MDKQLSIPFLHEYVRHEPVQNFNEAIKHLLSDWNKRKEELEVLYRNRDQRTTLEGMKQGIVLYIQFLFWSNDQPMSTEDLISLDNFEIKPVNLVERLSFIVSRPNLFHSYRQLSELMTEQEKLYAKKNIVKKASKPK